MQVYRRTVPLQARSVINRAIRRLIGRKPQAEPMYQDPGVQVAQMMQALVQSGDYRRYADLWLEHGFSVVPDGHRLPEAAARIRFEKKSLVPTLEPSFRPNLFLLGAAKAGTTTLYAYLCQMEGVCMSYPKEPFFFEGEYHRGLSYYKRRYFPHWSGEPIIGDARHRNLYLPHVPPRIAETSPHAKLMLILRNPIDRAYSHWWHWYSRGVEQMSFAEAIAEDFDRISRGYRLTTREEIEWFEQTLDAGTGIYRTYLDSGYYYEQLQRFLQFFPASQLKIVLFEDLTSRSYETLRDIEDFLGIGHAMEERFQPIHSNPHHPPREGKEESYGVIDPELRDWLKEHFKPHNQQLADFMNRDLSHWV
jgi:hypothetical protein